MIKLNKKIVVAILILFFLVSLAGLIEKSESKGILYVILSYLFFFDHSQTTKYDYILMGSLVLGVVLNFVCIFYKNIYVINLYSLIICGLSIFAYLKKYSSNEGGKSL